MACISRALIIGGGIAGPVAALALRRANIDATIYEAYATSAEGVGGMLMLAPNGLDALRVVGVDARALNDRALAEGIHVEYGKRLVDVDDTRDGVTARFSDGTTASGDIVIGADGIGSRVRTLIDASAPGPKYVGFLGFGGHSRARASASPDAMHFAFGRRAFLGYFTPAEGGTGWFSNLPNAQPLTMAQAREVPTTEWLRRLREIYADDIPGRDLLEQTSAEELLVFGAGEFLPSVPQWHRGRMVLVGDAAHAPSSTSGQGASLAAESAIQLARCVRDLPDEATAFAAYEGLRRPRVERVAAFAAKQNNQKVAGPIAKALMSLLMPIAMKTFLRPEKMFGWMHGYRIDWDERVAPPLGRAVGGRSLALGERGVAR